MTLTSINANCLNVNKKGIHTENDYTLVMVIFQKKIIFENRKSTCCLFVTKIFVLLSLVLLQISTWKTFHLVAAGIYYSYLSMAGQLVILRIGKEQFNLMFCLTRDDDYLHLYSMFFFAVLCSTADLLVFNQWLSVSGKRVTKNKHHIPHCLLIKVNN